MTRFRVLVAIIILAAVSPAIVISQTNDVIALSRGWKFMPGDSAVYAEPEFDESQWKAMSVDTIWEQQGYEKLDGFAWYRIRFTLPSGMRDAAFLKDGLRIHLAKINNFDHTYLNGKPVGVNGKLVDAIDPADSAWLKAEVGMWNVPRTYVLPVNDPRIQWDRENVIAVRVFDQGGQGGLWSGGQYIRMVRLTDYLALSSVPQPFVFSDEKRVGKTWTIVNTGKERTLAGKGLITVRNKVTGDEVYRLPFDFSAAPGDSVTTMIQFPRVDQACVATATYRFPEAADSVSFTEESPYVLTPKPGPKPLINGPLVYGARPDHPFLYRIPVTGERPMKFKAKGLPKGLTLDKATGIITGKVAKKGKYRVYFTATNEYGETNRRFDIVIGDQIGLTPQLGWNSWNAWGLSVDQEKTVASAKVFVEKGLVDHGWSYINIDDGWEIKGDDPRPKRDANGKIIVNEKFPDMKALGDSLHAMGLKFGIYSSPGTLTCGGYTASLDHELDDAQSYAAWGIDYLKYDWCSYDKVAKDTSRAEYMKPYQVMRKALDQVDRDIFYSLCQYGMGNVWEWGAQVGGNSWRTTGDITDTWESMRDIGFNQIANAPYAGPGHWNDPDMLVVGWVGWGPSLHPTGLTPDEQYTHISLWSLLASPLLIGCDLTRLDDFTLNLLTNDEVLAINQDILGKQAVPAINEDSIQVWVKPLDDGGKAIGIFNLGSKSKEYTLELKKADIKGKVGVRDVWRQKDIGVVDRLTKIVPSHGVVLVKAEGETRSSKPEARGSKN